MTPEVAEILAIVGLFSWLLAVWYRRFVIAAPIVSVLGAVGALKMIEYEYNSGGSFTGFWQYVAYINAVVTFVNMLMLLYYLVEETFRARRERVLKGI